MTEPDALAAAYAALGLEPGPVVVRTVPELRRVLGTESGPDAYEVRDRPRAVVMTMGALHAGHARLITAAREWLLVRYDLDEADDVEVVVTLFVNPLQFTDPHDLERYPRTWEADLALCHEAGADVVFAPSVEQMYPHGEPAVTVDPGALGDELEGAARPGHFRGVLTVVARLLHLVDPDAALFGEKDYQQLTLIRRMVRDLAIPVDVVGVPTVRDPVSGLARSSRNRFLTDEQLAQARAVPLALAVAQEALEAGQDVPGLEAFLVDHLRSCEGVEAVDYVVVRDPDLGAPPESGEGRVLVAVRIGGIRLLDSAIVMIGDQT